MADEIRLAPQEIERQSFEIIKKHVRLREFPAAVHPVLLRVVHATGDFQMARLLRFHPKGISAGVSAIRAGARIITDVNMVKAGINSRLLNAHGNRVCCAIHHADVAARAKSLNITRAAAAMQKYRGLMQHGIVAIGNAPTALFEVLRLVKAGVRPALIVGVPVGFVGAAESKRALEGADVPFITLRGTRGGSSIAVAIMNALLKLASNG